MVQTSPRLLSVIIATRNRVSSLDRLLRSLETSTLPVGVGAEVVIVDNNSNDGTAELLAREATAERKFPIRVLRQLPPGKSGALNLGLAAASGDLLLIFDDDVSVDALCIEQHVRAHERGMFDAVQGKILPGVDPYGQPADPSRLVEYNIPLVDHGAALCEVRGLTGTNISFKRHVFEKVGSFNALLGPGASGFSEDTEYSMRIRDAGFRIGYTPDAIVFHELDPARYGRRYNRDVEYRKGLSRSLYRDDSMVLAVIPNLLANCLRYGAYRLLGRTLKLYRTEGRILKCWGYLIGKVRGVGRLKSHGPE